jgi:hypothetical protein
MLLYLQTWLPLLTVTLTAAVFFSVASFLMGMQSLSDDRRPAHESRM